MAEVVDLGELHGTSFVQGQNMLVEELKNQSQWVEFLQTSEDATFYHSLKWKEVIEKSFPYYAFYLVVRDTSGDLVGICPGFIVKSGPLKTYVSIPHSDFGGPVIEKNYVRRASLSLLAFMKRICSDKGVAYAKLLFSNEQMARFYKTPLGYVDRSTGIMEIDLQDTSPDFIWSKVFSSRRRKRMKWFERDGFQIREICGKSDLVSFYDLYLSNMRYIGAQEYPYAFFQNVWRVLYPKNFNILLVEKKKTLGGLAFFKYRQRVYVSYLGMNRDLLSSRYSLGSYLYWEAVKWASKNGFRYVCLGSTPSDMESTYYSQKMIFGSSFYRQEMVSYPITYAGGIFLQTRTTAISWWRTIRTLLPRNFKDFIENRLARS